MAKSPVGAGRNTTTWTIYSTRFFERDGTSCREVGIGGKSGARKSQRWLPFKSIKETKNRHHQLGHLIGSLHNKEYLKAFIDMIQASKDFATPAPDAYAQFLNAIIGRPLAFVNIVWSLELATDEYIIQSKVNTNLPLQSLLRGNSQSTENLYIFPFKIGDMKPGSLDTLTYTSLGRRKRTTISSSSAATPFWGWRKIPTQPHL